MGVVLKPKRSYYIPEPLCQWLDKVAAENSYVKERIVCAGILAFLEADTLGRTAMLNRLYDYLKSLLHEADEESDSEDDEDDLDIPGQTVFPWCCSAY